MMKLVLIFICMLFMSSVIGQTLFVHVSGVRNASGNIRLGFYTTSENFDKDKPVFIKFIEKTNLIKGTLSASFTGIKPGIYGIAVLDDENNNGQMDYGLILPKEGFGFSDYYHTGLSKPKFQQFYFIFGTKDKTVEIKLRYL